MLKSISAFGRPTLTGLPQKKLLSTSTTTSKANRSMRLLKCDWRIIDYQPTHPHHLRHLLPRHHLHRLNLCSNAETQCFPTELSPGSDISTKGIHNGSIVAESSIYGTLRTRCAFTVLPLCTIHPLRGSEQIQSARA